MLSHSSPAAKRYSVRLVILMVLYTIAIFGTGWAFRHVTVSGAVAYLLAIVPALPIIGVFWAVMRLLVEEQDEYIRLLLVRQCMIATGFCLTVSTIWQFLQNYDLLPYKNGGFGTAFLWFLGLGVGAIYNWWSLRHADAGE